MIEVKSLSLSNLFSNKTINLVAQSAALVYHEFTESMKEKKILFSYSGRFNYEMIEIILGKAGKEMDVQKMDAALKKIIYGTIVECLENVLKHSDKVEEDNQSLNRFFKFNFEKQDDFYILTIGNPIFNENIPPLKNKIDELNGLDKSALKKLHNAVISSGTISPKGGAGLGLIDIAIKSGQKFQYLFEPLNENYSQFIISVRFKSKNPNNNILHMNEFYSEPTEFTPEIRFDPHAGVLEISGKSRPENVREFYEPAMHWIEEYGKELEVKTAGQSEPFILRVNFKLVYFNSASSKVYYDLIEKLVGIQKKGIDLKLYWYFNEGDEAILETGEELSKLVNYPFKFIEI